jgi:hypothetical protein
LLVAVDVNERREQHRWRLGIRSRIVVWVGSGIRIRNGLQQFGQ